MDEGEARETTELEKEQNRDLSSRQGINRSTCVYFIKHFFKDLCAEQWGVVYKENWDINKYKIKTA